MFELFSEKSIGEEWRFGFRGNGIRGKTADSETEGFVKVTGGRIWYKVMGKDRSGIPLLIVHGGPGLAHDYLEPLSVLGNERPIVFYDQLGCGRSDLPADDSLWTLDRFAEEIEIIRDSLDLGTVHILGHSNGTLITSRYLSVRRHSGVRSVTLSNPVLSASRMAADAARLLSQMPPNTREIITKCMAAESFDGPDYQRAWEAFERLHQCRMERHPDVLERTFRNANYAIFDRMWGPGIPFMVAGTCKNIEAADWLSTIQVPVLFITGRYDYASPESTRIYKEHTPNAELEIIDDASHFPHLEKPDRFISVVREFLAREEHG
jgi:proline iminopeptidase